MPLQRIGAEGQREGGGYLEAARAVAHSPSIWAICCMAVGATQIGESTWLPRMLVFVQTRWTSISTRGRMRRREKALRFSRNVTMSFAPEA